MTTPSPETDLTSSSSERSDSESSLLSSEENNSTASPLYISDLDESEDETLSPNLLASNDAEDILNSFLSTISSPQLNGEIAKEYILQASPAPLPEMLEKNVKQAELEERINKLEEENKQLRKINKKEVESRHAIHALVSLFKKECPLNELNDKAAAYLTSINQLTKRDLSTEQATQPEKKRARVEQSNYLQFSTFTHQPDQEAAPSINYIPITPTL